MSDVRMLTGGLNLVWKIREDFPEEVTLRLSVNGDGTLIGPKGQKGYLDREISKRQMPRGETQKTHQSCVREQTNYNSRVFSFVCFN